MPPKRPGDVELEQNLDATDSVPDPPQSGKCFGRSTIAEQRRGAPVQPLQFAEGFSAPLAPHRTAW